MTAGLRKRLREERRSLVGADRERATRGVAAQLLALPELERGGRLATYLPADGELDPNASIDDLRGRGWVVHLPVVGADRTMVFTEWHRGDGLVPNRYGIAEPLPDPERPSRTAAALDVVVVPCVAADEHGNRIGMGAGYYDRALAEVRERGGAPTLLIGIVHDDAVLRTSSPKPWDVPMHLVVTDRRVVRPARRA